MNRIEGTILVASLWIVSILSILAIGIGFRISVEARISKYNMDRMRALYLARAGFYQAALLLSKKELSNPAPDSLRQCGIILKDPDDPEQGLAAVFVNAELADGRFTVGGAGHPGPSDEERRININTADENVLAALLDSLNTPPAAETGKTTGRDIASAIIAWRSPSEAPSEDDYYESLEHPYERKKGDFSAVEELMLVRGMTPQVFNSVRDYVTIYGDKININTAPDKVLIALGLTSNIAGQITAYRDGPDGIAGTGDDQVFTDIDIEKVLPGPVSPQESSAIANLKNSFTIQSRYFRIDSKGMSNRSKVEKRIVCIVQKEEGKWPALKSYREY